MQVLLLIRRFFKESLRELQVWKWKQRQPGAYSVVPRPLGIYLALMSVCMTGLIAAHIFFFFLNFLIPAIEWSSKDGWWIFNSTIQVLTHFLIWLSFDVTSVRTMMFNAMDSSLEEVRSTSYKNLEEANKIAKSSTELILFVREFLEDNDLDEHIDLVRKFNETLGELNNYVARREEIEKCFEQNINNLRNK